MRRQQRVGVVLDRKSTRLNSSHTEIYTLSLHDALPILRWRWPCSALIQPLPAPEPTAHRGRHAPSAARGGRPRSEEHTSELQSHRDLHSFPTRRSSDLALALALLSFNPAATRT